LNNCTCRANVAELSPIPGLRCLLDIIDASDRRKIAVTNAPPPNVELMLEAIGLSNYFEDIVYGERCPRAKPHPDPYLIGLERIGLKAEEALVFEDSPSGIKSAVAAGITVIALATTQDCAKLSSAGASAIADDYTQIVTLIQQEVPVCA
jgi:HAD superfamily hydrolase (TIGR01509 family)